MINEEKLSQKRLDLVEKRLEEMKDKAIDNIENIAKKVWQGGQGNKVWLHYTGKNLHTNLVTGNTAPNPKNYDKNDLLVTIDCWSDIEDVDYTELSEKRVLEIVENQLIQNIDNYICKTKATLF